jgi:hypothetical protein
MARATTEKRRLIKFSNYSMCITLPKWVIDQLEWHKGDQLTLATDVKGGKITLYKEAADAEIAKKEPAAASSAKSPKAKDTPKLRW